MMLDALPAAEHHDRIPRERLLLSHVGARIPCPRPATRATEPEAGVERSAPRLVSASVATQPTKPAHGRLGLEGVTHICLVDRSGP